MMNVNICETTRASRSTDKVQKMDTLVEMPNEEEELNTDPKKNSRPSRKKSSKADSKSGSSPSSSNDDLKIPALDKYNFRTKSIQNRIETEKKRKIAKKEPKPKQKPPPLSKYRRRTANARERNRMQV